VVPTDRQPGFQYDACHARLVAEDYLVSVETNRYSVPFTLIGQPVEIRRHGNRLEIAHHGRVVAMTPAHLERACRRICSSSGFSPVASG